MTDLSGAHEALVFSWAAIINKEHVVPEENDKNGRVKTLNKLNLFEHIFCFSSSPVVSCSEMMPFVFKSYKLEIKGGIFTVRSHSKHIIICLFSYV